MFNIGAPELLVIAAFALIILGPEKFPTQAKVFLRMVREFREHWDDAKRDILHEINPVKKELRELQKYKPEELLDRLTGEDPGEDDTSASRSSAPTQSAADNAPTAGANDAPVEFDSTAPAPEGRSEASSWDRAEPESAPAGPPTEEDEFNAAMVSNDMRSKDGTD